MSKGKIKEFVKKNRDYIEAGIVGGVIAGVSYVIGYKACENHYKIGLGAMCIADPELYGRMEDAAKSVRERVG